MSTKTYLVVTKDSPRGAYHEEANSLEDAFRILRSYRDAGKHVSCTRVIEEYSGRRLVRTYSDPGRDGKAV